MIVASMCRGLWAGMRCQGPESAGAEARPTSQCSMGWRSLRALPYIAYQRSPTFHGKKESVP